MLYEYNSRKNVYWETILNIKVNCDIDCTISNAIGDNILLIVKGYEGDQNLLDWTKADFVSELKML